MSQQLKSTSMLEGLSIVLKHPGRVTHSSLRCNCWEGPIYLALWSVYKHILTGMYACTHKYIKEMV